MPVSEAVIGEHWAVGSALLQVAQPRLPCFKLGIRMGDPRFLKRFAAAGRPGAYLRILREGDIAAGDEITVLNRPAHAVTSALVSRALLGERHLLPAALQAGELPTCVPGCRSGRREYEIHSYIDVIPRLVSAGVRVIVPYLRGHGPTRSLDPSITLTVRQPALTAGQSCRPSRARNRP